MTEIDRNELKVQALLEKISNLTANYENQIADLRVELTIISEELRELNEAAKSNKSGKSAKPSTD